MHHIHYDEKCLLLTKIRVLIRFGDLRSAVNPRHCLSESNRCNVWQNMMAEIIFLDQLSDQTGKTVAGKIERHFFGGLRDLKRFCAPSHYIVPIKNAYLNQQTKGWRKSSSCESHLLEGLKKWGIYFDLQPNCHRIRFFAEIQNCN